MYSYEEFSKDMPAQTQGTIADQMQRALDEKQAYGIRGVRDWDIAKGRPMEASERRKMNYYMEDNVCALGLEICQKFGIKPAIWVAWMCNVEMREDVNRRQVLFLFPASGQMAYAKKALEHTINDFFDAKRGKPAHSDKQTKWAKFRVESHLSHKMTA